MQFTIPGGNAKGTPLESAETKDIQYWEGRIARDLQENPQKKFADRDAKWLEVARKILADRKNGAKPTPSAPKPAAPAEQTKAIEQAQARLLAKPEKPAEGVSIERAIHDPTLVNVRIRELSQNFHMVTPVTSVDALPPGCGISISYVTVDPNTDPSGPKEVYKVGDRLGLSMDTLKRIAAAAGVDWDPRQSGRLDDGSDPHYCHYRAVGFVRNFDGALRTLTGEVEMDLRDGSPQLEEIITKAKNAKDRSGNPSPRDPQPQILEQRKFILRHAESKAKNRAIADMGVKRSYAAAELQKAFAVARIVWTGQTDDPALKETFAKMHAERMMDGAAALYGRQPPALPATRPAPAALPAPAPEFRGHAPPPVGYELAGEEPYDTGAIETTAEPAKEDPSPTQQKLEGVPGDQDRGANPDNY